MDTQGAAASPDRSHGHIAPDSTPAGVESAALPTINGLTSPPQREGLVNGVSEHARPGESMSLEHSKSSQPPELDQSWRSSDANKSLGALMDRLAQQCYFDLNDTLTKMDEKGVPAPAVTGSQTNGVTSHVAVDTDPVSQEKKRMLLEFASDQRDRFTKSLVLSDWSRRGEDMARLIDVKVEQDKQRFAFKDAASAVAEIKRRTVHFKQPAPNIESAIELFATGKASGVPDLGLIPPKRLTAKQLLRTLKDMNVTLATRLNLHEDIPRCMQQYTIANGRATFTVDGEFAVDLSVAEQDPTSPLYFIDIRLLFHPTADTIDENLRPHLESRVNDALRTKGLSGCFDFLHNFFLTHKINVLRHQSSELVRGKWFGCIRVEGLRRSLVVRYWAGTPGPKSWFEIGVSSGREGSRPGRQPTSRLVVRWFREGVEVKDDKLAFDWVNLSLEDCLTHVISKHAAWLMHKIRTKVAEDAQRPTSLILSVEERFDGASIEVGAPWIRSPLTLGVDGTTGQVFISPPSAAALRCLGALNNGNNLDLPQKTVTLACFAAQEQLEKTAQFVGWEALQNVANVRAKLGNDVVARNVFRPSKSWSESWAMAVSFSSAGPTWWIVELANPAKPAGDDQAMVKTVTFARLVIVEETISNRAITSHAALLQVEKLGAAEVSQHVLTRQLQSRHILFRLDSTPIVDKDCSSATTTTRCVVWVRLSDLVQESSGRRWKPRTTDVLRVTHQGFDRRRDRSTPLRTTLVRHDLRLSLDDGRLKHLQQFLTANRDGDIRLNTSGGLAVKLRTEFGEPLVERIQGLLNDVEQLDHRLSILQRYRYTATSASLSQLAFIYSVDPPLSAQLTFSSDESLSTKLQLSPADVPSHLRMRVPLETELTRGIPDAFERFVLALCLTRPLLRALDNLETAHIASNSVAISVRGATSFDIEYALPFAPCAFNIRTRGRVESGKVVVRWYVELIKLKSADSQVGREFKKALGELWREKGDGWFGASNGAIANITGVEHVINKIDDVVRMHRGFTEESMDATDKEPKAKAKPAEKNNVKAGVAGKTGPPAKVGSITGKAIKKEPDVITLDD